MDIVLPVIIGFFMSSLGVLLPGLLNMTAAKISLRDGRHRAIVFACGATVVVFIQAYVSITFAKLINRNPDIIDLLEETGFVIFSLLTIFFFFFTKAKPKVEEEAVKLRSKTGNFFLGMLLSSLNFFPIPYYVFISITFAKSGHFSFDNLYVFLFVLSATLGAFAVFYLYIVFFRKISDRADFFMKNSNYFIGTVTGFVAIISLIKIVRG